MNDDTNVTTWSAVADAPVGDATHRTVHTPPGGAAANCRRLVVHPSAPVALDCDACSTPDGFRILTATVPAPNARFSARAFDT